MRPIFLKRVLKDPLLHFLVVGFVLFAAFELVSRDKQSGDVNRIIVDRDRLLAFMQYRSKVFDADRAKDLLDNLPEEKLQALIDDFVRDEALYREAKALNLDKNDYALRQRLIRQLEFINEGFISANRTLSETDLQRYLDANKDRYTVAPKITFTHVFFSAEKHGDEKSHALALAKLKELNGSQVRFHEALSHGDRFLYHRNYVNKAAAEIASHFGSAMQANLLAQDADEKIWRGPFRSLYGFHLVMVTRLTAGYVPPLAEVRQRVMQDAMEARMKKELDRINQSIVDAYEVEVVDVLKRDLPSTE